MKSFVTSNKFLIAAIFVLSFLAYVRTIDYDFVWDDQRSHLNAHEDFMQDNVKAMWSETYDGMYIPVTYTTWWLVKKMKSDGDELDPKPYHILNVLTHAVNVILVFLILQLFFGNSIAACIGSLLFALHPLQTESVVWISEFRGLLSSFFSLLAMYILFKSVSRGAAKKFTDYVSGRAFLLSTLFFICAMLSKPSVVMLPIVIVVLAWCFYKPAFAITGKAMLLWILLTIPVVLNTGSAQSNEILTYVAPTHLRIFLLGFSAWFYIAKIFAPIHLVPSYGITPQDIVDSSWAYAVTIIILGIAVFLFLKREKLKHIFAGFLILIISILPVSGLASFYFQRYSNVADRYIYFGMFGVAMLFAYLWIIAEKRKYFRYAISLFITGCLVLTITQQSVWKSEFSIWNSSMEHYPNQFQAAYNRGVYYTHNGKSELAIADYTVALKHAENKDAYVNRANDYARLGKYAEALTDYDAAIAIDPNDGSIYYNRALTNYNMGNFSACPADIIKAQELGFPIDMEFAKAVRDAMHGRADTL